MSKTLYNLLENAKTNSKATINGRIVEGDYGYTYKGDLREKWAIEFDNDNLTVELRHWGTELIKIQYITNYPIIDTFYAESKSDVDGINWFISQFPSEEPYHAHYYPSRETAELHDFDEIVLRQV